MLKKLTAVVQLSVPILQPLSTYFPLALYQTSERGNPSDWALFRLSLWELRVRMIGRGG